MEIEFSVNQEVWVIENNKIRKRVVRAISIDSGGIMFNIDGYWTAGNRIGATVDKLTEKMKQESKDYYDKENA